MARIYDDKKLQSTVSLSLAWPAPWNPREWARFVHIFISLIVEFEVNPVILLIIKLEKKLI